MRNGGLKNRVRSLIGNRAFYRMVFVIVVPIIVQNAITNFVGLLDNLMVGRIGTEQMSGVSISNQLIFVFNLCVFGGISGAGIFSAQFHGAHDHKSVGDCFRFKLYLCILLCALGCGVFLLYGENLISLYLNKSESPERIQLTLQYGIDYLKIMLWGLAPFAMTQCYAGTLRETGETAMPMRAGIIAVFVNLVFNSLLIYGLLGFPKLGVRGAAIATVLSRYVELAIVVWCTHRGSDRYVFIRGIYRSARVPMQLVRMIFVKGMPLLVNEALWSIGVAMVAQCYSVRGLDVVAAMNISSTTANLFSVAFISMGNAVAIILGQELGANDIETAKDHCWKLAAFSVASCMVMSVLLAITAPYVPMIYNTTDSVRALATRFLLIVALCMPLNAFANCSYFTLRSGGKTLLTFFFDCGFSWLVSLPLAYALVQFTGMNVVAIFLCVQGSELLKCIAGYILIKKGIWVHNIVAKAEAA